jgi:cell shape-determining protein MreC
MESLMTTKALVTASIVLRSPTSGSGEVVLNRGASHGLQPGTVAVYNGVHLLGRVTNDVTAVQSTLLPLTNKSNRLIECRVIPHDQPDRRPGELPRVGLEPLADGTFTAQPNAAETIAVGDTVRLDDTSWPTSAQKMIVGLVESVESNDLDPLRKIIIVRPAFQVSQVTQVVLRIEELQDDGGSGGRGPGG